MFSATDLLCLGGLMLPTKFWVGPGSTCGEILSMSSCLQPTVQDQCWISKIWRPIEMHWNAIVTTNAMFLQSSNVKHNWKLGKFSVCFEGPDLWRFDIPLNMKVWIQRTARFHRRFVCGANHFLAQDISVEHAGGLQLGCGGQVGSIHFPIPKMCFRHEKLKNLTLDQCDLKVKKQVAHGW